jgi:hypothetical protein
MNKQDFENCKIWIDDDQELGYKIQEKLFELGFEWVAGGKKIEKIPTRCFFTLHSNITRVSSYNNREYCLEYFNDSNYTEIFPHDLGIGSKDIAVHCTTQKEWDFVVDSGWRNAKANNEIKKKFGSYDKVCLSQNAWDNKEYYDNNSRYKVITFSQWLKESGNEEKGNKEEPKPKFKVGDWVKIIQEGVFTKGDIFKLTKENFYNVLESYDISYKFASWRYPDQFRLATQEEIDSVKGFDYDIDKSKSELDQWIKDNKDFEGDFEKLQEELSQSKFISMSLYYAIPGEYRKEKAQYIWDKWGRSKAIERPDEYSLRYKGAFGVGREPFREIPKPQETTVVDKSEYFPKTDKDEIY